MTVEPVALLRRIDDALLARHPDLYGREPAERALAFARALTTSSVWSRLRSQAVLAVRPLPQPMIAVFGVVADEDRPLLDALGWHTDASLRRLRPIGYAEAERACETLAEKLRARFADDVLDASSVVGIPRGGSIVAGLLAYALGLPSQPMGGPPAEGGRLLVVDDCVLSGSRLARWLDANPGPTVVAVHLASVPSCREAIMANHPRVSDCIAAIDLVDHSAEHDEEWHERWMARSPGDLWTGDPEHVVFPWNEPDAGVWNAERAVTERAWRIVPPSWCLKNRVDAGSAPDEVQYIATGANGPHGPADDVVWAELGGDVAVAGLGDQRAIRLSGVAAVCWHQLVRHGDAEAAGQAVAAIYEAPEGTVRSDLARLVERLAARGLLRSQ